MFILKPRHIALAAFVFAAPLCAQSTEGTGTNDGMITKAPEKLYVDTAPAQNKIALNRVFEKECFEAETCADTTFEAALEGRAGGIIETDMVVEAKLISVSGTTDVLGVRSGSAMSLAGGTFEARHLLTIAEDGAARYTLHYSDGPMVISYLGTCS